MCIRDRLIISPDGADGSLSVRQNARVYAGLFDGAEQAHLQLGDDRYAYVHVARGSVQLNGEQLQAGDGVRLRDVRDLHLSNGQQAEVLVFNLRPNELPSLY